MHFMRIRIQLFFFNADPDPAFVYNADSYPSFTKIRQMDPGTWSVPVLIINIIIIIYFERNIILLNLMWAEHC